ncbi:MAG: tRNA pseudouridine(38-40) synthase TruA [Lachnospiraceae bacterium]
MKRIKLTIAYDGTNYCGWQIQPNGITIEEVLNNTLSKMLKEEIIIIGASRTDSGVHALGNVAVFDTQTTIPPDRIAYALNRRLPEDIVIVKSEEVNADFHPRYCNSRKTYQYNIINTHTIIPTKRLTNYFVSYKLDIEKMRQAAAYLVGEHDFISFCNIRTDVKDTVRTITEFSITQAGDEIQIVISGNGFLYNMVRIIIGTLIRVGRGFYEPEKIQDILEAKDRKAAGATAPAHGLTLVEIEYLSSGTGCF